MRRTRPADPGQASTKRATPKRRLVRVTRAPFKRFRGLLHFGARTIPIALGRSGIKADKREGDGATPRGRFRLIRLWWRADRSRHPPTSLPIRAIRRDDAWCEDPAHRRYNRSIRLEAGSPGDRLWRKDHLYDLLIELDHNSRPRIAGRGSAVFVHIARPGLLPTAGCVAMPAVELRRLLSLLGRDAMIEIG